MSDYENGWHIRSDNYMEAWHVYQKVNHMKVGMALDNGDLITFVRLCNGVETDERRYVPLRHTTEMMLKIFALEDENRKLRDYAHALEECVRESNYCEFCPQFGWMTKEEK